MHASLILTLLLLCSATASATSWDVCRTSAPSPVAVQSLVTVPDVAERGEALAVQIELLVHPNSDAIVGGDLVASVRYMGYTVYSARGELCASTHCPVQPGDRATVMVAWPLPGLAPPGPYEIELSAYAPVPAASAAAVDATRGGEGKPAAAATWWQSAAALLRGVGSLRGSGGDRALPGSGGKVQLGQAGGKTQLFCVVVSFYLSSPLQPQAGSSSRVAAAAPRMEQ